MNGHNDCAFAQKITATIYEVMAGVCLVIYFKGRDTANERWQKTLIIYFHHMDVARDKKGADNTPYNIDNIDAICNAYLHF